MFVVKNIVELAVPVNLDERFSLAEGWFRGFLELELASSASSFVVFYSATQTTVVLAKNKIHH